MRYLAPLFFILMLGLVRSITLVIWPNLVVVVFPLKLFHHHKLYKRTTTYYIIMEGLESSLGMTASLAQQDFRP